MSLLKNLLTILLFPILLLAVSLASSCSSPLPPSKIKITGVISEGDSITISFRFKFSSNYCVVANSVISKEMASKKEISIPINTIHSSIKDIMGFRVSIYAKQDEQVSIYAISLENISSIPAKDIINTLWWQNNINFIYNANTKSIDSFISQEKPATFDNNIFPYLLKYHYKKVYPIGLVFILVAILLFSLNCRQQSLIVIAIIIYTMCLPLKISWSNWALLGLGFSSLITLFKYMILRLTINPVFYGIVAIFLIYLVGFIYSINPEKGWDKIPTVSILFIFTFFFSSFLLDKKDINFIFRFFIHFALLYSIYLIICYIQSIPITGVGSLKESVVSAKEFYPFLLTYPSFNHPSFITIIMAMGIPIAIYLKKENIIKKIELFASIILISIVIILSGARIGLIVLPLTLLFGALFYIKISQQLKFIFIIVSGIVIIISLKINFPNKFFSDPIRDIQRKTAIAAIKEKPLFGWGTGSMETLLHSDDIAQKAGLEKPIVEYNHFHNQYLDMLVQFGILGSLPFFALFAYLIYLAIKRKDFLLMLYLAIYLPFMYVESPFATVKGIQPMIFWLCFLLSTQKVRLNKSIYSDKEYCEEKLGSK